MVDSDQLSVLLDPRFANMRVATYADIITPEFMAQTEGRWIAINRGMGDPHQVATVADVETGALSVGQAHDRIQQWTAQRRPWPTVYHNRASWAEVNETLHQLSYTHWVATLDGTLVPDKYYMAVVQFAGELDLGIHADMSIIWADNWHPMPVRTPSVPAAALKQLASDAQTSLAHLVSAVGKL